MSTGGKIAIIVSSVLLIGGGIAAFYYFKNKKRNKAVVGVNKLSALSKDTTLESKSIGVKMTKEMMKK
jgi:hypothetical protein